MQIGVCVHHHPLQTEAAFAKMAKTGFSHCQLISWDPTLWTEEERQHILAAAAKHGITVTAFWCGWTGPVVWDFYEGQTTLGLVPPAYRAGRAKEILAGAKFAKSLGVDTVVTHVGFLPENPLDPQYTNLVTCLREIAKTLQADGQSFLFESGQETPVTLLRTIEDIGLPNVGVNFDTANVILYGKANPVDALDVFGPYVRGVHCKDGFYPTNGRELGVEVKIGQGKANLKECIKKLHALGYTGSLTIEREIQGAQQDIDILEARDLLAEYVKAAETE